MPLQRSLRQAKDAGILRLRLRLLRSRRTQELNAGANTLDRSIGRALVSMIVGEEDKP